MGHTDIPLEPLVYSVSRGESRGHSCTRYAAWLTIAAALLLIVTLPLVTWLPGTTWHDQQRIGQVLALTLTVLGIALLVGTGVIRPAPLLDRARRRLVALVIAGAILSTFVAHDPQWAFTEVALGLSCLGLAWVVATLRRCCGVLVDRLLLAALAMTCAGLLVRFVVAYVAAICGEVRVLNAWLLLDGFSNPRFYGQFLTLALPLLVTSLLATGELRRYTWIAVVLTVLAWTVAIASGTRGTWLGLACAAVMLAFIGRVGRRWAMLQAAAACAGATLFWLMLTVVPDALGMVVTHHATSRMSMSLSGREIIWSQAIAEALRHPLLGIGPMQLAGLPNGVAAHPHQAWLQWAAELGVPSALLVSTLVGYGAFRLVPVLRALATSRQEQDVLRLCLTGSMVAALSQAMVDGVLVMPYSQLWLALLAGWLVGLQPPFASQAFVARSTPQAVPWPALSAWLAIFTASVVMLNFVVVRDYSHLAQREKTFACTFGIHSQPRFWAQGVIDRSLAQQKCHP